MNKKGLTSGILALLQAGPATTSEIANVLDFDRASINATLSKLRQKGYLLAERAPNSREYRWRLADAHPPIDVKAESRSRILETISERPATTEQLSELIKLKYWTVNYHLQALIAERRVRRVDVVRSKAGRLVPVWGLS